ncbi:transthyretin precursor-like [Scleropages formosus]|uniref:Transthyretin n=1 Tax=Scleropages formosus TaxID=113540 RepID=A0A0P7Y1C5_SCLFO|nr:transthyretin precursor-like [Scleropages formosus]
MSRPAVLAFVAFAIVLSGAAPLDNKQQGGSDTKCPLAVKVLDAVRGAPATAVQLKVSRKTEDGSWTEVAAGVTDTAGEVHNLIEEKDFTSGVYKATFDTQAYWTAAGRTSFHEAAEVTFKAHEQGHQHYTLALLLSPFSYMTTAVVNGAHE